MAKIDLELTQIDKLCALLRQAHEDGDAEAMYEITRQVLGVFSRLLARFAVLQELRQEAGFAAEVDRALNRSK